MASCVIYAYRYFRYSEEENRVYYEVRSRHEKIHKKNLLASAFPVFVAAVISSAVNSIIEAITEHEEVIIGLSFAYAMGIAQVLGYVVIFNVPTESQSFRYYFRIATENSAFAWKEFVVLVLMNQLYSKYDWHWAMLGYVGMAVSACLLVALSNFVHVFCIKSSREMYLKIKLYESEVFALGLAFALNLMVVGGVCGYRFLSFLDYTDDDSGEGDDANFCTNYALAYALVLTYLLTKLQSSGLLSTDSDRLEEAEDCLECEEEVELERLSIALEKPQDNPLENVSEASSEKPMARDAVSATTSVDASEEKSSVAEDEPQPNTCQAVCTELCRFCDPVDQFCCSWDEARTTTASLRMLLLLVLGSYVGCAWYTYSVESIGSSAEMEGVGHLIFALIITSVGLHLMVSSSTAVEVNMKMGRVDKISDLKFAKLKVMLMALRLVVGWCWEEVVIGAVDLIYPDSSNGLYVWIGALIKVAIAISVFLIGRYIEAHTTILRQQELEVLRDSVLQRAKDAAGLGKKSEIALSEMGGHDSVGGGDSSKSSTINPMVTKQVEP